MSMLASVMAKEEERNLNMIYEYTKELDTLPKGSVRAKKINGKIYYYLNYRSVDKVISKYIGKDEKQVAFMKEKIERRCQIEIILKKLKAGRKEIIKMEGRL